MQFLLWTIYFDRFGNALTFLPHWINVNHWTFQFLTTTIIPLKSKEFRTRSFFKESCKRVTLADKAAQKASLNVSSLLPLIIIGRFNPLQKLKVLSDFPIRILISKISMVTKHSYYWIKTLILRDVQTSIETSCNNPQSQHHLSIWT